MRVPSVRGLGGKGKCVDYSLTSSLHAVIPLFAHNWTFGREDETRFSVLHPASPRIPYPSHASSRVIFVVHYKMVFMLQIIILHAQGETKSFYSSFSDFFKNKTRSVLKQAFQPR